MNGEHSRIGIGNRIRIGLLAVALLATAGAPAQDTSSPRSLRLSPTLGASSDAPAAVSRRTATKDAAGGYRVDTGDRVSIIVYDEPDLSVTGIRVGDDGTIPLPLLGDLSVRNLNAQEVKELVMARLADGYLKKPSVSVSIDGYRLYYIKGEVTRPGGYSYLEGLTVDKAVALAGGYTERASEKAIKLAREGAPGAARESVPTSTPIRPGDVITVGESFF